jgi:hypothetical protein
MLKDSRGIELSKESLYHVGEGELDYLFQKYVTENKALFSAQNPLTPEEPCELVLSQTEIDSKGVFSIPQNKDSKLESAVSQS